MKEQLRDWLVYRPTEEEIDKAMEEAKTLLSDCNLGQDLEVVPNLKRLIQWAMLSHHLPVDWLAVKVQEELYGEK